MKFQKFIATAFSALLLAGVVSCGTDGGTSDTSVEHATTIFLPDSALVGRSFPDFSGNVGEILAIDPEAYTINLRDSVLTLAVDLSVKTPCEVSEYTSIAFANEAALLDRRPYIVLTDSVGAPIPGFYMTLKAGADTTLTAMMSAAEGTAGRYVFESRVPLSPEQKDTLAMTARNFRIVATCEMVADEAKIDALIDAFEAAANAYSSAGYTYADSFDPDRMRQMLAKQEAIETAKARAAAAKPFMSPAQQGRYSRISGSYNIIYWD